MSTSDETIGQLYDRLEPGVPTNVPEYGLVFTRWQDPPMSPPPGSTVELDERNLAHTMHEALCKNDHTEGCGWGYEIHAGVHSWNSWAHKQWLQKAHALTKRVPDISIEDLMTIIRALA